METIVFFFFVTTEPTTNKTKTKGDDNKAVAFCIATKQKGDNNKTDVAFFVIATQRQKAMATTLPSPYTLQ